MVAALLCITFLFITFSPPTDDNQQQAIHNVVTHLSKNGKLSFFVFNEMAPYIYTQSGRRFFLSSSFFLFNNFFSWIDFPFIMWRKLRKLWISYRHVYYSTLYGNSNIRKIHHGIIRCTHYIRKGEIESHCHFGSRIPALFAYVNGLKHEYHFMYTFCYNIFSARP